MGVAIGDSGFCCCVCVTSFECKLTHCLLILHRHSGPHSVLDYRQENIFLSSPFPTVKKLLLCEIQVPASVIWPPVEAVSESRADRRAMCVPCLVFMKDNLVIRKWFN